MVFMPETIDDAANVVEIDRSDNDFANERADVCITDRINFSSITTCFNQEDEFDEFN